MMSYFVEAPLELEKPMQWPAITESKAEKAFMKRYSRTHKKGMEFERYTGLCGIERYKRETSGRAISRGAVSYREK